MEHQGTFGRSTSGLKFGLKRLAFSPQCRDLLFRYVFGHDAPRQRLERSLKLSLGERQATLEPRPILRGALSQSASLLSIGPGVFRDNGRMPKFVAQFRK